MQRQRILCVHNLIRQEFAKSYKIVPNPMEEFSFSTKLYILGIMIVGLGLCVFPTPDLSGTRIWIFLLATVITSITQIFQVTGVNEDSTYNASVFGYSMALLALGRAEASWVALISFLSLWLSKRRGMPWYVLGFNIGVVTIPVALASSAFQFITNGHGLTGIRGVLGVIAAGGIYIFLSQVLFALLYWLIDGKSFSGSFDWILIASDATQFAMGATATLVWLINPFALLFVLSPLYFIQLTLQLPRLKLRAETDSKTGLLNARFFIAALEKELTRVDRAHEPLSVVMADLDFLREINNTHGHLAGDAAIVAIANILKKLVRNYDIVSRFGGEEFAIIMPETDLVQAQERLDDIRQIIASTLIRPPNSDSSFQVTMSFGVAAREQGVEKPSDILHRADVALYQAKQTGRNRVCRFVAE
jgi:diguanylate cyclase (GGDEF)-like protein